MQYTQTELPVDGLLTNKMLEFFALAQSSSEKSPRRADDTKTEVVVMRERERGGGGATIISWFADQPKCNLIGRVVCSSKTMIIMLILLILPHQIGPKIPLFFVSHRNLPSCRFKYNRNVVQLFNMNEKCINCENVTV